MKLRTHQQALVDICCEIMEGKPINRIYADVTPGGGKSALPVILANCLLRRRFGNHTRPPFATKLIWVVPRSSLKVQGEGEFTNPYWDSIAKEFGDRQSFFSIRSANNDEDMCRGLNGYIATYQAVAARSWRHKNEVETAQTILFLDEPHHISESGEAAWHEALRPMVENAKLVVFASGTFARGDGKQISFVPYKDGRPNLQDTKTTRVIRYTRTDALIEQAILPVQFYKLGGAAIWEKSGSREEAKLSTNDSAQARAALYTALRTDYAFHLLDETYNHWKEHRKEFPFAELLVVAPDIAHAEQYLEHLKKKEKKALLATSKEDHEAKENIKLFKNGHIHNVLITVGMAYEGMNVPEITHIACLTNYRSIPWLEQCFARANRISNGKTSAFVFVPDDKLMVDAIKTIDSEQVAALGIKTNAEGFEGWGEKAAKKVEGIIPISSQLHIQKSVRSLFTLAPEKPSEREKTPAQTPSEREKELRTDINHHVGTYCREKGWSNRTLNSAIKSIFEKSRSEMSLPELEEVWKVVKEKYPL